MDEKVHLLGVFPDDCTALGAGWQPLALAAQTSDAGLQVAARRIKSIPDWEYHQLWQGPTQPWCGLRLGLRFQAGW